MGLFLKYAFDMWSIIPCIVPVKTKRCREKKICGTFVFLTVKSKRQLFWPQSKTRKNLPTKKKLPFSFDRHNKTKFWHTPTLKKEKNIFWFFDGFLENFDCRRYDIDRLFVEAISNFCLRHAPTSRRYEVRSPAWQRQQLKNESTNHTNPSNKGVAVVIQIYSVESFTTIALILPRINNPHPSLRHGHRAYRRLLAKCL